MPPALLGHWAETIDCLSARRRRKGWWWTHLEWEQLHQQFGSLGVRYVRDGLDLRTSHLEDLWKRYGVRFATALELWYDRSVPP